MAAHSVDVGRAGIAAGGRLIEKKARRFDFGLHVGEHKADSLVLADRLAEGDTLFCIVRRVVECAGGNAQRLRRNAGA